MIGVLRTSTKRSRTTLVGLLPNADGSARKIADAITLQTHSVGTSTSAMRPLAWSHASINCAGVSTPRGRMIRSRSKRPR